MSLVLLCFSVLMTIFFPILALPINIFGIIFARGKIRKCYGFLITISLALIAYIWVPDHTMDLYRHHQQVSLLTDFDVGKLGTLIKSSLEPLHYLIKFIVAQTGNNNLLQFIVVLLGYSGLFWLICDFAELKQVKNGVFTLILFYVFTALRFIDFASGLWFNLAIICISMGVYLKFFKNTKYLHYIFYILAACLHVGVWYIILIILIFTKLKLFKKIKLSTLIITFLIPLTFGGIIYILNSIFGDSMSVISTLNNMYNSYFINGEQFIDLYAGWNMFLRLAAVVVPFIIGLWFSKKKVLDEYGCFVIYLAVHIVGIIIIAGVFARYGFLMTILSIPLIAECLNVSKGKKVRLLLTTVIILLTALQTSRFCSQIQSSGLLKELKNNVTSGTVQMLEE